MIVLIDNYDSFTYNLVHYLWDVGASRDELAVIRNDRTTVAELERLRPSRLIISPGPCTPDESGITLAAIERFSGRIPVLGVCLGHQAIAQVFGGRVVRARMPVHGKVSRIEHDGTGIFLGVASPCHATRYHSLIVDASAVPECLRAHAWCDGEIMALQHRQHTGTHGVQFHPESIMTPAGKTLLKNFLEQPWSAVDDSANGENGRVIDPPSVSGDLAP